MVISLPFVCGSMNAPIMVKFKGETNPLEVYMLLIDLSFIAAGLLKSAHRCVLFERHNYNGSVLIHRLGNLAMQEQIIFENKSPDFRYTSMKIVAFSLEISPCNQVLYQCQRAYKRID